MKKIGGILASCANILCVIHCIGFAVIGSLFPLVAMIKHLWWLDWVIMAVNLIFGNLSLANMQVAKKWVIGFNTLILISFLSISFHAHNLLHTLIVGMAAMQVILIIGHHRQKKQKKDCCSHHHS